jgi:hypothetical protein
MIFALVFALFGLAFGETDQTKVGDKFLSWDFNQARRIALTERVSGQVGKSLDLRIRSTDRSYNFKLRATWLSPTTIQALARLAQLTKALDNSETLELVSAAIASGDIIIQVEIDPREGSGIIPSDWIALLGPRRVDSGSPRVVRGLNSPKLRDLEALAVVPPRDYSYELFWLVFPSKLADGLALFSPSDGEAELAVQIQGKIGKVRWPIPTYLR